MSGLDRALALSLSHAVHIRRCAPGSRSMSAVRSKRLSINCALLVLLPLLAYAPHAKAPAEPFRDWRHAAMFRPADSLVCALLHSGDARPVIATAGQGRLTRVQQDHGLSSCGLDEGARAWPPPAEEHGVAVVPPQELTSSVTGQ